MSISCKSIRDCSLNLSSVSEDITSDSETWVWDLWYSYTFRQFPVFLKCRRQGAVLVDNVNIDNLETILDFNLSGEASAVLAEFKIALNVYLKELLDSPVRSLSDIIIFNQKNPELVCYSWSSNLHTRLNRLHESHSTLICHFRRC